MNNEITTLRRRQSDVLDELDGLPGDSINGAPAILVRVFAESAVPVATDKYFACHPLTVSGTESEGSSPTMVADTGQKLYVAVIGSKAPASGDNLIARQVGGRWVAERCCGTTSCNNGCVFVYDCNTATGTPIVGASVTYKDSGGATVGTGTTYSQVKAITVTNIGSGYVSVPAVTIAAPSSGATATATAILAATGVASFSLTSAGAGYITAPAASVTGGGGSGATATTKLAAGAVTLLAVTTGNSYTDGSGYALGISGDGTGAAGTFDVYNGSVYKVALTSGGSGYTAVTAITFPGTGSSATAFATLSGGAVNAIFLTSGGGYTNGTGYSLSLSGGAGTGASGTFDVVGGQVCNLVLTAGGSSYTSAPTLSFSGAGAGAGATGISGLTPQAVASITRTLAGANYSSIPTVTLASPPPGGTQATATATLNTRTVASIRVTDGGTGYGTAPTVTVAAPPSGTTALATATAGAGVCFPVGAAGIYSAVISNSGYVTQTVSSLSIACNTARLVTSVALIPDHATFTTIVKGCNFLGYPGLTVTFKQSGVTVNSGTTDSTGTYVWAGATTGVSYSNTISGIDPAFNDPGTTSAPGGACPPATRGVTLTPVATCINQFSECVVAPRATLTLTDSVYGVITLSAPFTDLRGTGLSGWGNSRLVSYSGCGLCVAKGGVGQSYTLDSFTGTLSVGWTDNAFPCPAPGGTFNAGIDLTPDSHTCPPSLLISYTMPANPFYCSGATITITQ